MKIKTMQDLDDAVTKLVGGSRYFSVKCESNHHKSMDSSTVEWTVYHEDMNHYEGVTPQAAFDSFKAAWDAKHKKQDTKEQMALVGEGPHGKK